MASPRIKQTRKWQISDTTDGWPAPVRVNDRTRPFKIGGELRVRVGTANPRIGGEPRVRVTTANTTFEIGGEQIMESSRWSCKLPSYRSAHNSCVGASNIQVFLAVGLRELSSAAYVRPTLRIFRTAYPSLPLNLSRHRCSLQVPIVIEASFRGFSPEHSSYPPSIPSTSIHHAWHNADAPQIGSAIILLRCGHGGAPFLGRGRGFPRRVGPCRAARLRDAR